MHDYELLGGGTMPAIGLGTWKMDDETAEQAVTSAVQAGYRMIDTAAAYENEAAVGAGLRAATVPREDVFITTKLRARDVNYESAKKCYSDSLDQLGLERVDLYLIHWPKSDKRNDAWRALVELRQAGDIGHIGVSNYTVKHLEELQANSDQLPEVNQIELHPYIYEEQRAIVEYCQQRGIVVQAYSPIGSGNELLQDSLVGGIAGVYHKTPAQLLLRWAIQHGTVPLPKSSNQQRQIENIDVFDFEITDEHMKALNGLSKGQRVTPDPHDID